MTPANMPVFRCDSRCTAIPAQSSKALGAFPHARHGQYMVIYANTLSRPRDDAAATTMTVERSHGKPRPRVPRPSTLPACAIGRPNRESASEAIVARTRACFAARCRVTPIAQIQQRPTPEDNMTVTHTPPTRKDALALAGENSNPPKAATSRAADLADGAGVTS